MEGPRGLIHIQRTAQVMTTDSDLWVVPRYEKLHLINILALQQQLSSLEGRIQGAAKCEYQRHKPQDCSSSCAVPNDVLLELQTTIKAFDDAILAFAAIKKTEEPAPHVFSGLKEIGDKQNGRYLTDMLEPPHGWNSSARKHEVSHLLSISTGSRSWFHRCVEKHDRLGRLFQAVSEPVFSVQPSSSSETKQREQKHAEAEGGSKFRKFSENSVKSAEFGLVAGSLCLVQLLPVLALTLVSSKTTRLAMIIVLIVLVSLLNSLFAHTVQATNFGAVAAYSAIVVAFISQDD